MTVSLETTCDLLFGPSLDGGPMQDASDIITRFVATPDTSTISVAEIDAALKELKAAETTATSDLHPYIDAEEKPLLQLKTAMTGGENSTIQFSSWKAAGLELLNKCK